MPLFGIEKLKGGITLFGKYVSQTVEALHDGWQWLPDLTKYFDELMDTPAVVRSIPAMKQEIDDLDEDERTALMVHFKEKFDLPDDKVELFIEYALEWIFATLKGYELFKALKALKEKEGE